MGNIYIYIYIYIRRPSGPSAVSDASKIKPLLPKVPLGRGFPSWVFPPYLGSALGCLGKPFRALQLPLGCLGAPLAPLGVPFGPMWLPLGCLGASFGVLWVPLGALGRPWWLPWGSLWASFGMPWGPLGTLWASLGGHLAKGAQNGPRYKTRLC